MTTVAVVALSQSRPASHPGESLAIDAPRGTVATAFVVHKGRNRGAGAFRPAGDGHPRALD
jgi:hypothetical protein